MIRVKLFAFVTVKWLNLIWYVAVVVVETECIIEVDWSVLQHVLVALMGIK